MRTIFAEYNSNNLLNFHKRLIKIIGLSVFLCTEKKAADDCAGTVRFLNACQVFGQIVRKTGCHFFFHQKSHISGRLFLPKNTGFRKG